MINTKFILTGSEVLVYSVINMKFAPSEVRIYWLDVTKFILTGSDVRAQKRAE